MTERIVFKVPIFLGGCGYILKNSQDLQMVWININLTVEPDLLPMVQSKKKTVPCAAKADSFTEEEQQAIRDFRRPDEFCSWFES